MMAAAVNCLVNDASLKFVLASIGRRQRKSVIPYPRRNPGFPLRTTRTAAPGALLDFSEAKTASIWSAETWAEAVTIDRLTAEKAKANSTADASRVFKKGPSTDLDTRV